MDMNFAEKSRSILNEGLHIMNDPRNFRNRLFKKKKSVTVITATYNAEMFIRKGIESVIHQTFPFVQIEFILVDDGSTDGTKAILEEYSTEHKNIISVFLDENTGSPAIPRNIGIELATGEHMMFLDADDWLDEKAIEKLLRKMDESASDFVVGATIKVTDDAMNVHASFMSYKERTALKPSEIPYLFYHMGPPAKLAKAAIIKEHDIRFPELKFAEDKYFFTCVLDQCERVSTITEPICYINRLSDHQSTLTRKTNMKEKRIADLEVLRALQETRLKKENEPLVMRRLLEYDFIRSCDSQVFINHPDRDGLLRILHQAFDIAKQLPYNIVETFERPFYRMAAGLLIEDRDAEFMELFEWKTREPNKEIVIKDAVACHITPLADEAFRYIPIPLFARALDKYTEDGKFIQTFEIYGELLPTVSHIIIQDRNRMDNALTIPCEIDGNSGKFEIEAKHMEQLESSLFTVFIQYDGYKKLNIKRLPDEAITYMNRQCKLYFSKSDNLSLSLTAQ